MQRIASHTIWQFNLFFLFLLPSIALASNSTPEDYLASKSLMLEVRYCECLAANVDSAPSDLLPSFLEESSLLTVSVSSGDKGFVSSSELSIGYEFKPVTGSPNQFQFSYAGHYITGNGNSAGYGKLLLVQGQWLNVFGSREENETGSQHSNIAVRLAKPGGS